MPTRPIPILAITMTTLFLGCSTTPSPARDLLRQAVPVHLSTAQGIALGSLKVFSNQLAEASEKAVQITTLETKDLFGEPMDHIHVVGPEKLENPLQLDSNTLEQTLKNGSWRIVLTGASTARSVLVQLEDDARILTLLNKAVARIGGHTHLVQVISPYGGLTNLLLKDTRGTYWSVNSGARLPSASVAKHLEQATIVRNKNNTSQLMEELRKAWAEVEREKATLESRYGSFTNLDGSLNTVSAQRVISKQSVRTTRVRVQNEWTYCTWGFFICFSTWEGVYVERGGAGSSVNLELGLNQQRASDFGQSPSFRLPGLSPSVAESSMGCAPSAAIRLIRWMWSVDKVHWFKKANGLDPNNNTTLGLFNLSNAAMGTPMRLATNPVFNQDGSIVPDIAQRMGTVSWYGTSEGYTSPDALTAGLNSFFVSQRTDHDAPNFFMKSSWVCSCVGFIPIVGGIINESRAQEFALMIRSNIASNRMVLAMYPTGRSVGFELHFAPVKAVRVIYYGLSTQVQIKPKDYFTDSGYPQDSWIPMANPWANAAGVWEVRSF
jgi:hypothetical protein